MKLEDIDTVLSDGDVAAWEELKRYALEPARELLRNMAEAHGFFDDTKGGDAR